MVVAIPAASTVGIPPAKAIFGAVNARDNAIKVGLNSFFIMLSSC